MTSPGPEWRSGRVLIRISKHFGVTRDPTRVRHRTTIPAVLRHVLTAVLDEIRELESKIAGIDRQLADIAITDPGRADQWGAGLLREHGQAGAHRLGGLATTRDLSRRPWSVSRHSRLVLPDEVLSEMIATHGMTGRTGAEASR